MNDANGKLIGTFEFGKEYFFEVKDWCHKEGIEFYYSGELFDTYSGESNIKYTL